MAPPKSDHNYMRGVGARISALRQGLGLTQRQLGQIIGVSQQAIMGYESGERLPSPPVLGRWCDQCGVSLEWIYRGDPRLMPHYLLVAAQHWLPEEA